MPDPLRQQSIRLAAVELDHLQRRRVAAEGSRSSLDRLGARPIAGVGGLHNRGVVAPVIDPMKPSSRHSNRWLEMPWRQL